MSDWVADWFFGQVQDEIERRDADPGLPAYPWDCHGKPSKFEGHDLPLSYVAAVRTKRFPVLINLDELRRSVMLALAGTPDVRTPQQKSRDAWRDYQAAKEKYERGSSAAGSTGPGGAAITGRLQTGARQGTGSPQGSPADGQEPEAGRQAEGPAPTP